MGVDAVVMSQHNAPLGSVTLKASAGAAEALPLIYARQPPHFVEHSKQHGWKFYAAAPPGSGKSGPTSQSQPHFNTTTLGLPLHTHPCVLMLGNEGAGLSMMLQKRANYLLSIIGDRSRDGGGIDSLNVGVAAGLLCEAFKPSVVHRINKDLF